MALTDYDILSEETGVMRGAQEWRTRVVLIPNEYYDVERANYARSLDNKWPGDSGLYAFCIHRSTARPDPVRADTWRVTCHYTRPTEGLMLIPGRGVREFRSTAEMKRVWWGQKFVSGPVRADGEVEATMTQTVFTKGQESMPWPRGTITVRAVDVAEKEQGLAEQALNWLGKTNKADRPLLYNSKAGTLLFFGGRIRRRPVNMSEVEIEWYWLRDDDDKWEYEIQDYFRLFPFDEAPTEEWQAFTLPMNGTVARGETSFAPVASYLSWIP